MHENLEKVVRQWRDAGNALLAKDPDDRGTGSSSVRMIWKPRCAPKNRGRSSEQFWQPGRSCSARSSWNTNTVRKLRLTHWPRHGQDYQKFRPYRRDDTEREGGDRDVVNTVSVVSTSGSNVVVRLENISWPEGPQWRIKLPNSSR